MLENIVFQKDHYSTDLKLVYTTCEIIKQEPEWIYIKVDKKIRDDFSQIKREIIHLINRNPEMYCDAIKTINVNEKFQEVLKVKCNEITFNETNCDIQLCVYGIWFSKSSYGPMVKLETVQTNQENNDSDEEIFNHFSNYKFYNKLKN
jgi:hypothetical protein